MSRAATPTQATPNPASDPYIAFGKDVNGSVEYLANETSGVSETQYRYDPYGNQVTAAGLEPDNPSLFEGGLSGAGPDNPIRFQGHYYDSGVRVYDMKARSYLPSAGRFLTRDQFESASGDFNLVSDPLTQNRYAFAGGNPISNVEFDGHYSTSCGEADPRRCKSSTTGTGTNTKVKKTPQKDYNPRPSGGPGFHAPGPSGDVGLSDKTSGELAKNRRRVEPRDPNRAGRERNRRREINADPKTKVEHFWDGVFKGGKELVHAVSHPQETAEGIKYAFENPGEAANAMAHACDGMTVSGCIGYGLTAAAGTKGTSGVVRGATKAAARRPGGTPSRTDAATERTLAGEACLRNSFVAGTPILMADGSVKPIEHVTIGDRVLATDPTTGATGAFAVSTLIRGAGTKQMVRISVAGKTTLATAEHPVWSESRERWVAASDLRTGELVSVSGGGAAVVDDVDRFASAGIRVFNFTVAEVHTYYAGGTPILVHNASCGPLGPGTELVTRPKLKPGYHYLHERKMQRGLRTADVLDAYKRPLAVGEPRWDPINGPSIKFVGRNAQVVVNPHTGVIVTAMRTHSRQRRQLLRRAGLPD